jgi:hypothetical protein
LLVLSVEEFPGKSLPKKIRNQTQRGLEVIWVPHNGRSFDKLLPVFKLFPESNIITFDDDKFFPPGLIASLVKAHRAYPNHVIGARGWQIVKVNSSPAVRYGKNWKRAKPGDSGQNLLMPGGNGTLYPVGTFDQSVLDIEEAFEICPTADDIWFWGHIRRNEKPMHCLGLPPHRPLRRKSGDSALSATNEERNDVQFQAVMDAFGIRERVELHALQGASE